MLARQMFGYAPSLVVTALVSFASVTFFTSLMSQSEYGQYSLAVNAMTMLIGVCFFWLQSAASRLMAQAMREGREAKLSRPFTTFLRSAAWCCWRLLRLGFFSARW